MKGRVEKRYESSWTLIIELGYKNGERQRIVESVEVESKEKAEEILADRMYEIRHKKYIKRDNITFGGLLDKWLDIKKSKLAPMTYHSYHREIEGHIKPVIGNIPLQDLEAIDLQEYYLKMEQSGRTIKVKKDKPEKKGKKEVKEVVEKPPGLSQRTINYHHRIMTSALKQAVKWKMIPYNPALFVDIPTYEKKEMSVLHKGELEKFLGVIEPHLDRDVLYTAVMTGMRQGELLGIRWQDIDFDSGMINIRVQMQYLPGKGHFFKTPKSKKSKRVIPMQLPLSKLFRDIKKNQENYIQEQIDVIKEKGNKIDEEVMKTIYDDHDLVLCQKNGKPWDGGNLTNRFKVLITKFGRPELRFHDLRHTFAALALAAGISMDKLQRIMGHESITTTIDMYGHFSPETLSEEMKKLSHYLGFDAIAK